MKVYVVGSLRKEEVEHVSAYLREWGHDVFDDWRAAGPRADDEWREYFQRRGMTFKQALQSDFVHTFVGFDKRHIDEADAVVGVNPTGLSSGLELFYAWTKGKLPVAYFVDPPERWDGMWALIEDLVVVDLLHELREVLHEDETARRVDYTQSTPDHSPWVDSTYSIPDHNPHNPEMIQGGYNYR